MEPVLIGVSLKMYFGYRQTLRWCAELAEIAADHPTVRAGSVVIFVLPSFPAIHPVLDMFRGSGIHVGGQNLCWAERGAYTGEVSGSFLAEMGCTYVEVGHAERRRLFGEDAQITAVKTIAALRAGLIPVLCLGEEVHTPPERAADLCIGELNTISTMAAERDQQGSVVVAYEPQWANGVTTPAATDHIAKVCSALSDRLHRDTHLAGSRVIYGGTAGPSLLSRLGGSVDGLFLGRFAHDPHAVGSVLDEVYRRDPTR